MKKKKRDDPYKHIRKPIPKPGFAFKDKRRDKFDKQAKREIEEEQNHGK